MAKKTTAKKSPKKAGKTAKAAKKPAKKLMDEHGKKIPLDTAKQWVNAYKEKYSGQPGFLSSMLFSKSVIDKLMKEKDSKGKPGVSLRIYNAIDDNGQERFVLIGADKNGNNILPKKGKSATLAKGGSGSQVVDEGLPCPPNCPPNDL